MLTHWALRRLAAHLAGAGAHVLRFDYFGTGDSGGQTHEGTLERWERDVVQASNFLTQTSKIERVSLIGYRLGASLAWKATLAHGLRARDLVLWEPIVSGRRYLSSLIAAETVSSSKSLNFVRPAEPPLELLGFPMTSLQYDATMELDLLNLPLPNATRTHLFVGQSDTELEQLRQKLHENAKRFNFEMVTDDGAHGSGQLLSHQILLSISSALVAGGS
jgi:pimeloyl-ACP methyl ester carboxylesterase